jgi:hypothetical protein
MKIRFEAGKRKTGFEHQPESGATGLEAPFAPLLGLFSPQTKIKLPHYRSALHPFSRAGNLR